MSSALLLALVLMPTSAGAQDVPAQPIPESPHDEPAFIGKPAEPNPVSMPSVPEHPHMAPNGRSNLHVDAYASDVNEWAGPLGRDMERVTNGQFAECASLTFDSRGRIVTICVGLEGPRLELLDPETLDILGFFPLPPREPGGGNPFTEFGGGATSTWTTGIGR